MTAPQPVASVVIAAHNEAAVIGRGLSEVVRAAGVAPMQVVVVTNGCSDDTAAVARSFAGVDVLELTVASKVAALRAGDRFASAFPRVYLDADVTLPAEALLAVVEHLAGGYALAARPPVRYEFARSSPLVRRYYRARSRMPSVTRSLWGAGVYALTERGRARFDEFPDLTGDDLFVDRLFTAHEIAIVDTDPVVVEVPRTAAALLRILRRAQRGTHEEPAGGGPPRGAIVGDLRAHAGGGPAAALESATYAAFALLARWTRTSGASRGWERDDTSREL